MSRSFLLRAILLCLSVVLTGCQQPVRSDDTASASAPASDETWVWVRGMSCPKCANNITFKLRELPGISNVRINMGTGLVKLKVDPGEPPREDILRAAITNSGFTFVRAQFGSSAPDSKDHQ